ncbi:chaperonin [Culex quinquefasciatus]|uniref:Chaperonin n=1 Tax=Culex quinquefasciatus TaxID=7176 RepID=B0X0C9_CULQU|nr:chaperonin [Culex quinquefasciatus]|eukprot:XP_001863101.1 chaperonin [Culex quinquefasciatus]
MDKILIAHGRTQVTFFPRSSTRALRNSYSIAVWTAVEVTNDGATILKAVGVDMSRFQDDEVGDGMTSVTVRQNDLPAVDSFLDKGFLLDKKTVVHKPKRIANAKILIANTPMDTDKIKDSMVKIAELDVAEKEKMKDKVITRSRLVSVVVICSKVCIDVIARSNIRRTLCRNISQGG